MICKRCEVTQIKPERMVNGYCRHCHAAVILGKCSCLSPAKYRETMWCAKCGKVY
jgi:hypothetical protein